MLLYVVTVGEMVVALLSPGTVAHFPGSTAGVLADHMVIPYLVLLAVMGLRDKAVYLAARAEMYWIASFVFLFPTTDMIMGFKLALCAIWIGAGVSKLTHNFTAMKAEPVKNEPPSVPNRYA